jgi:hypothetical protein
MATTETKITVPHFDNWYDIAQDLPLDGPDIGTFYLRFDPPEERVTYRSQHPAYDGTPVEEYHGRVRSYGVQPKGQGVVDATSLTAFLESEEAQTLLRRIRDGFEVEFDGENRVGQLTGDANRAEDRLEALLVAERPHPSTRLMDRRDFSVPDVEAPVDEGECRVQTKHDSAMMTAGKWLDGCDDEELGIREGMTDEEIRNLAGLLRTEALEDARAVLRDVEDYIRFRLEEARA